MPARVSPTPLMLTSRSRLAHSSGSSSIVSAMAWSTASSWEVKCWIVALASDSAMSSSMPLVLWFVHSVKPATVPARIVWSSHNRRRAGEGGVQGRGLNSSAYSRVRAASTGSVFLRPSLVRAKSRIWAGLTRLTTCPASCSASAMPRLWRPVASRQAWTCRTPSLASQAISWRQPSGELAKLLDRGFVPARKLVSSVFLETSMPRTASVILRVFQVLLVGSLQQPLRRVARAHCCTPDRVTGGSCPPPVPTERGVQFSRTTLFDRWFTALCCYSLQVRFHGQLHPLFA